MADRMTQSQLIKELAEKLGVLCESDFEWDESDSLESLDSLDALE